MFLVILGLIKVSSFSISFYQSLLSKLDFDLACTLYYSNPWLPDRLVKLNLLIQKFVLLVLGDGLGR